MLISLEDDELIRNQLTEAVVSLCRNALPFTKDVSVQGLLGITLDKQNVFLLNINDPLPSSLRQKPKRKRKRKVVQDELAENDCPPESELASPPKQKAHAAEDKISDSMTGIIPDDDNNISSNKEGSTFGDTHDNTDVIVSPEKCEEDVSNKEHCPDDVEMDDNALNDSTETITIDEDGVILREVAESSSTEKYDEGLENNTSCGENTAGELDLSSAVINAVPEDNVTVTPVPEADKSMDIVNIKESDSEEETSSDSEDGTDKEDEQEQSSTPPPARSTSSSAPSASVSTSRAGSALAPRISRSNVTQSTPISRTSTCGYRPEVIRPTVPPSQFVHDVVNLTNLMRGNILRANMPVPVRVPLQHHHGIPIRRSAATIQQNIALRQRMLPQQRLGGQPLRRMPVPGMMMGMRSGISVMHNSTTLHRGAVGMQSITASVTGTVLQHSSTRVQMRSSSLPQGRGGT